MPAVVVPAAEVLTRSQRFFFGIVLLLVVDIIWVASSEFTIYIFKNLHYDKPFFSTYFKTSLFMIYLSGFLFYRPWREQIRADSSATSLAATIIRRSSAGDSGSGRRRNQRYERINDSEDHFDNEANEDEEDEQNEQDEEAEGDHLPVAGPSALASPLTPQSTIRPMRRSLSSPTWVPANIPESGKSSGTESEPEVAASASRNGGEESRRRVRFKNLAQVVEMNPGDALYANLARLSYNASLRAQAALRRAASRLTVREVLQLALLFAFPWFVGNYCYQSALSVTEAAVVNVLSSSSCLFTLILSAIFPSEDGDRITLSKLSAVCFSICGVVLVCYEDLNLETRIPFGALWTVLGAFCYSVYIVLLRRRVNHEDNMDSPMFFGFVGLFSTLILWPGLLVLHLTGRETFELPTMQQLQFLVINGVVGTVFSELLWLWGCFLTSSLVATLSISLTIPLGILADIMWKQKEYGALFFVGAIPMFCSYFIVALLAHYDDWDPLLDLLKSVCRRSRRLQQVGDRRRRAGGGQMISDGGEMDNDDVIGERQSQERQLLINQQESSQNDGI
jgi:solute carrier family 35 protein F5